jgi:hypothetical protein
MFMFGKVPIRFELLVRSMKMEETFFFKMSAEYQRTTRHYIPKDITLQFSVLSFAYSESSTDIVSCEFCENHSGVLHGGWCLSHTMWKAIGRRQTTAYFKLHRANLCIRSESWFTA